jgi:hypothetical protein
MNGDFTRSTFRPANHYASVRLNQGRVILDADLNEEADIVAHLARTTEADVIGPAGAPFHLPSEFKHFAVQVAPDGQDLLVAPGRIYVDGILCENEAAGGMLFTAQPDLPGASLPDAQGSYMVFLDVWERHVGPVDQFGDAFPPLREAALGGPDTATRARVVWQVKLAQVDGVACQSWTPPAPPTGKLRASAEPTQGVTSDCSVPAGGGYRRLENQLYRVEIHRGSEAGTPGFKWSRDNGSMASKVKATDQAASVVVVEDAGRDEVLGFASARFVELSDEERVLNGRPGLLLEVDVVTGTTVKVKNPANASLATGTNPVLRRWDGTGEVAAGSVIPLEDGVEVEFDAGTFATGDYWMIPARTLTAAVEWPDAAFEPRHGTVHHFCRLAIVAFNGQVFTTTVTDCRELFPPLTAIKASDVSYDPAACANLAGTTTVQQAFDKLCQVQGGDDPGIHIVKLGLLSGVELTNDALVPAPALARGLQVALDKPVFQDSVRNQKGLPNPVCSVTLELPWPMLPTERDFWQMSAPNVAGYHPLTLAAQVNADGPLVVWVPLPEVQKWLAERLMPILFNQTHGSIQIVLARLVLRGNFIWGPKEPELYLDGDAFAVPSPAGPAIKLPSGNGRRGGNFEMWFWLTRG